MKQFGKIFTVFLMIGLMAGSLSALSIRVLPGGIPIGSADQMIAEGTRLGSTQLLRQAWDAYEKAVKMDPKMLNGYLQLGRIYFQLSLLHAANADDFNKAKSYIDKAMAMAPDNQDVHHTMGMVLSGKGEYLDALDELKLALSFNPGNEYVICDLASIHLALRQPDKTIHMLEGKSLKNGWSYFVLAMAWLQKQQKGHALLNLKKAEKIGFSGYWLDLAMDAVKRDISVSIPFMK